MEDSRKKSRCKDIYSKTNDEVRKKLLYLVNDQKCMLKDAAEQLGINYSTAKTILRIWRIEKRICKKYSGEKNLRGNKGKIFKVIGGGKVEEGSVIQRCGSFSLNRIEELGRNSEKYSNGIQKFEIAKVSFSLQNQSKDLALTSSRAENLSFLGKKTIHPSYTSSASQNPQEVQTLYQNLILETQRAQLNNLMLTNLKSSLLKIIAQSATSPNQIENYYNLYSYLERMGL